MNSKCIISQVHVPAYDVQGGLLEADKLKLVEFGIRHLREFNPDAYIILSGHGKKPTNTHLVDYVYWEDECRPLDKHGYVLGMPAQYFFVHRGLEHARSKGFKTVLKTRGDCVVGIRDIISHCDSILTLEGKKLLITQQSGPDRMGDCFMYGDTELLYRTWFCDNLVYSSDGLQNTAYNFRKAVGDYQSAWLDLVKSYCSFRDVVDLKFMCLRWNFFRLKQLDDETSNRILRDDFPFNDYHWGLANGAHIFNNGVMSGSGSWLWSKKSFYGE